MVSDVDSAGRLRSLQEKPEFARRHEGSGTRIKFVLDDRNLVAEYRCGQTAIISL
jgi:hypothetical protein